VLLATLEFDSPEERGDKDDSVGAATAGPSLLQRRVLSRQTSVSILADASVLADRLLLLTPTAKTFHPDKDFYSSIFTPKY
jgi:hypothetical protein